MINRSCCFTGHRHISKANMPYILQKTEEYIRFLIENDVIYFYVGGALGYDTLVAELLFRLRNSEYPKIKIFLVYPFEGYTNCWTDKQREKYNEQFSLYNKVICISETDDKEAYLQRNRYLVENTKYCVCYCNRNWGGTAYTVRYAKQSGLKIYNTAEILSIYTINFLNAILMLYGVVVKMIDINQAKTKICTHNRANPYVDITPYELQVGFPIVNYPGFFPQSDEVILYAVPAATFKDKEQVVGYTGKSAGASVRVAKGLTIRTGSSGGSPIRSNVRKHNFGDLIITNKRVLFIGKDDSFDFAVNKISAVRPLGSDSFVIQSGRSSKNILVDIDVIIYTAGFVNYVVTSFNDGLDIKVEKEKAENEITLEQRALCDTVRQEIQIMSPPNSVKEVGKRKIGCFTRILFGLLIFFAVILTFVVIYGIFSSSPNHGVDSQGNIVEVQSYTDTEILYKEGHPLIYDSYNSAKDFYADADKNKVKVISIADHAAIERKLESLTSDEVILYLIQHSTYEDYVGTVQINLFSPELTSDMSIDKAVDLLTDYLPDGFGEYYSQDSCYKYSQNAIDIYTWSGRLNELGTEYHNNGHSELSYYYYLKFIHYTETNQWKLETGYAAYGDKDLGWIEKYADPWEIDMGSYFVK